MKAKTGLISLAVALVLSGANALTEEEFAGYLEKYDNVLVTADTGSADSSFVNSDHWAIKEVPETGKTYYVPAGMRINDPSGAASYTFPGTLVLAGYIQAMCSGGCSLTYKPLRMQNGAEYRFSSFNKVLGEIYVDSSVDNPAKFMIFHHNSENVFTVSATFYGAEDNVLAFARSGDPKADSFIPGPRIDLSGKFGDYYGSLVICSNALIRSSLGTWGNAKIKVEREGYLFLNFTREFSTVRSLVLEDGARLMISPDWELCEDAAPIYVTEELKIGNDVKLENFVKFAQATSSVYRFALARLSDAAYEKGVSLPERIDLPQKMFGGFPRNPRFEIADDKNGEKTLYVIYESALTLVKNGESSPGGNGAFTSGNDDFWSPVGIPESSTNAEIFVAASSILWGSGTAVWPNAIFHLHRAAYIQNNSLYANFELYPGSSMMSYGNRFKVQIDGNMVLHPGDKSVSYTAFHDKPVHLHSRISGDGSFAFVTRHSGAEFHIYGTNDCYGGNMRFYADWKNMTEGVPNVSDVYLYDSRNLGGAYTGQTPWKAIAFETNWTVHVESADIRLDAPGRGVAISDAVTFAVGEGLDFAIAESLNFAGVLTKRGTGTLTLAGVAIFGDGEIESQPEDGKNRLVVEEGNLRLASTNAIDGVQVELGAGSLLVFDVAPEADGMAQWGAVCKKWATPFADNAEVNVKFEDSSQAFQSRPRGRKVAICTLPDSVAATLVFNLGRVKGMAVALERRDNGDGTVTVLAAFEPKGMTITVR